MTVDWFTPNRRSGPDPRAMRQGRRPSVTELLPQLLVGEYPRPEDIRWLRKEHGVTAVLNLQDDADFLAHGIDIGEIERHCTEAGVKLIRFPIADGSADDLLRHLREALDTLAAQARSGERIYLHCNAGLNRAPTVAIAFLHREHGMKLDEAMAFVKARRPCGPYMSALREYFGEAKHPTDDLPEDVPE